VLHAGAASATRGWLISTRGLDFPDPNRDRGSALPGEVPTSAHLQEDR
jgi:hypothetical protein